MKYSYILIAFSVLATITALVLLLKPGEDKAVPVSVPVIEAEDSAAAYSSSYEEGTHDMPEIVFAYEEEGEESLSDETIDLSDKPILPQDMIEEKAAPAPWRENALSTKKSAADAGKAHIVIIIDDMGMDKKRSEKIMALPAPLTLAFLPYAPHVADMAARARDTGHELMVHMPMEPMNPDLDTGPMTLRTGQDDDEFNEVMGETLGAFTGYVGINNHMGSRLTQDEAAMDRLMEALKKRGLLFVDSRTIATSVAAQIAAEHGLPYAARDVFLDHDPSEAGVQNALAHVERVARTHGTAIAIGHPKDATINGLAAWLPTLKDKGFVIVPITAAVTMPEINDSLPSL